MELSMVGPVVVGAIVLGGGAILAPGIWKAGVESVEPNRFDRWCMEQNSDLPVREVFSDMFIVNANVNANA